MKTDGHPDYVQLGSTAVVLTDDGERETYVVVAPREADPRAGLVSSESPLGRALLGRRIGESVVIRAPGGSFSVQIERVEMPVSQPSSRELP
jgi:transcription elongation factor GreA